MIKRLNKKAASESAGVPVWLIVALIAAVLVILFVSGTFGTIGDIFGRVKTLEIMAQSCNQYAVQQLKTSYCISFDEVKIVGKNQYVNCDWLVETDKIQVDNTMECGETNYAMKFCNQLKKTDNYNPKTTVNGQTCEDHSVPKYSLEDEPPADDGQPPADDG